MCGIIGYIGQRQAYPIVLNGLKRLEYRGYDSSGIALLNGKIDVFKKKGNVSELEKLTADLSIPAQIGIGHTRWATHGPPNDLNAHPHLSRSGRIAVIHNGIIENYASLRKRLESRGYVFRSETDSEVLAHLIEEIMLVGDLCAEEAVRLAIHKVQGTLGLVVMNQNNPHELIAVRRSSPLVIGLGDEEYFIASDATPIIEYTRNVIYLNDNDIAVIRPDELKIKNIANVVLDPEVQTLDFELDSIEKGGYEHFMLKEIYEQPKSLRDCMRGRLIPGIPHIHLGGLSDMLPRMMQARRLIILGCGTSWHAGLVGEYLLEDLARIPTEVEYASEFRYRNPILYPDDVIIAISQSGETADTLAALELADDYQVLLLGIVNAVGSSIPRKTHAGVYIHAGPEIGVASTKVFTSQITALLLISILLGKHRGTLESQVFRTLAEELERLPELVAFTLRNLDPEVQQIAEQYCEANNFLYLGRGYNFPIALEGALKLKEISYIHAEGYPAAEMKHGPIALIDENMPVVVIATQDKSYEKIRSNIEEVKARHGKVIAVVTQGDTKIRELADHTLEIPRVHETLIPILAVLPLQLLAYYIARLRGCNVDQPRNLAKSVTVE